MQTVVETPAFLSDARSLRMPGAERLAIVTWIANNPAAKERRLLKAVALGLVSKDK